MKRWKILAVALVLGMGPFLHAHFGSSSVTGFHLDAVALPSSQAVVPADQTWLTAAQGNESPAVGVASAYPSRQAQVPDASLGFMLLLFVLSVLPVAAAHGRQVCSPPRRQLGFDCPGLPPPAQAPPLPL